MERHELVLEKKKLALEKPLNYIYIGNLNLDQKAKLLVKIFEKAPVVDDSNPQYERLYEIAKKIIDYDEIGYWFGKRIDISLKGDYVLTNVFDEYTKVGTIQKLVEELNI